MKKLIVFPQDKGGIGKSFIATLIYDYLSEQGVKLKTSDLDHANSTFQRFVPESEFIDTDVDADKLAVLDKIVNALESADVVLVDNRASGGTKVLRYIEDSRLTELQKELQLELIFIVVALDDKDAISQIADLLDEYHDRVSWLVVRNYRDTATLTMNDESQTRTAPDIAQVFCPESPTFDIEELDLGRLVTVKIPQEYQTERNT
jgi:hypothetical protein